jgi:hypothetical protein
MKFSLLFAPVFVQAVLHKEFVGAKSDKLLDPLMPERALQYRNVCGWKVTTILGWHEPYPNRTNIVQNHNLSTHLVRERAAGVNKPLVAQCLSHKKPWHNSCSTGSSESPFFSYHQSTQES